MSKMDNIFRNKLAHSKDAHPEHLWKAIEQELEGESKRPMGWMFITSAIILFAALFGFWYFSDLSSAQKGTTIAQTQEIQQGVSLENITDTNSSTSVGNNSSTDLKESDKPLKLSSNENNQSENGAIHSKNTEKSKKDQENTSTSKNAELLETASIGANDKSNDSFNTESNTSIIDNNSNNKQTNTYNEGAELNGSSLQIETSERSIKEGQQSEIKWKIESTDNVTVKIISAPQIIKRKAFDRRRELFRAPIEISSRFELDRLVANSTRLKAIDALASSLYIDCPTFSSDRTGMHLDLYMNHEMPFQSLSAKNNGDVLLGLRQDSETSQYSYSYGGRISLILPSGLSLRTGFNYSKINQTVSYADEKGTQLKSNNSHQLVEIPFLLGYEFGNEGSRIYYTANAGVLLNVRYTQEGSVLNEDMVLSSFSTAAEGKNAYSDSAGASLFGSFAVYYRWLSQFDLYLEPNIRFMPGSLSSEEYKIDEKYTSIGVMTGVRYRF